MSITVFQSNFTQKNRWWTGLSLQVVVSQPNLGLEGTDIILSIMHKTFVPIFSPLANKDSDGLYHEVTLAVPSYDYLFRG